jgi:hypothetical protein
LTALDAYRESQAHVRREFAPLTRELCPACPAPCCRIPARVTPGDVMLAIACGWSPGAELAGADPVDLAARQASQALAALDGREAPEPCPFLSAHGCAFPPDLRPYGCTAYVCRPMLKRLDARGRARLRRLLAELERRRARLGVGLALPSP